jgi:hypothetical protein
MLDHSQGKIAGTLDQSMPGASWDERRNILWKIHRKMIVKLKQPISVVLRSDDSVFFVPVPLKL